MKKITIILLLCVAAATAIAQKTLSGTILSKTDGQPIEMATVRLFAYPKEFMPAPSADMPDSVLKELYFNLDFEQQSFARNDVQRMLYYGSLLPVAEQHMLTSICLMQTV